MTDTMDATEGCPGTDEEIRDWLARRTRPWQSRSGNHPPLPVSTAYGVERVRRLLPATVPVAVADPASDDLLVLLRQARDVNTWIGFPRYDCLIRFLAGARDGDRPRGLYAWLTRYRDKSYLSTTLPLVGVIAAIAGALLQGHDGHGSVWGAGLVAAVLAVVLLAVEPAVTAWYTYARIHRLWQSLEDDSLAHAARRWSQEVVRDGATLDDRFGRLLAAAYFTDIAAAWDHRLTVPVNWFRAWRADYPVLIAGLGAVRPAKALGTLVEVYHKVPRRGAVLVLPAEVPLPEPVRALDDSRVPPPRRWGPRAGEPPFLSDRRGVRRAIGGALLTAIVVAPVATGAAVYAAVTDPCRGMAGDVDTVGDERVGFQTCGEPFWRAEGWSGRSSTGADDGTWEDQIYQENQRLPELAARSGREVLTILLVTSLTRRDANGSVVAETEGLAGAYAAQKEINRRTQVPLVRLAVVNAGDQGLRIKEAMDRVEDFVARPENRVVAAVVTVNSTSISQEQLQRLDRAGLVQLSPTMTADGFGEHMTGFFQMIAPNGQQAKMVVKYALGRARKAHRKSAAFFHVAPPDRAGVGTDRPFDDLYIGSLRQKVGEHRDELVAGGMSFDDVTWRDPGDDLSAVCARPDRYVVVYYGGRYTEFPAFVEDLRGHCDTAGMPDVVANDSVSRFLMDPTLAADVRFGVAVTIASRGPLLSCAHYSGRQGGLPRRRDFAAAIRTYLGRCDASSGASTDSYRLAGGWTAGSYDALSLLHAAAQRDRGGRIEQTGKALRELRGRMAHVLAGNEIKGMGVVSPVTFTDRVASRTVWLYCVPELRTAFNDGRSPADGSAAPVAKEGDSYEQRVDDVLVGERPAGCVA